MTKPFKLPAPKWPEKVERDAVDKLIETTPALFEPPAEIPETALDSIYKFYPRKENHKEGVKRIREALERICAGEIDGQPRTQAQAIEYLREKTKEARIQMYGRARNFIPHPSTWYHQSRYLQSEVVVNEDLPKHMDDCAQILSLYPTMPSLRAITQDYKAFLPALCAIDKALDRIIEKKWSLGQALSLLKGKTLTYAQAVEAWPVADRQYVPSPKRFYEEHRYEQHESTWQRKQLNGFDQERKQIGQLLK